MAYKAFYDLGLNLSCFCHETFLDILLVTCLFIEHSKQLQTGGKPLSSTLHMLFLPPGTLHHQKTHSVISSRALLEIHILSESHLDHHI